jgi:hypothetical protein
MRGIKAAVAAILGLSSASRRTKTKYCGTGSKVCIARLRGDAQ